MKTARIYARLSDRSDRSIDSQIEDCREYCKWKGYAVDHVYNEGQGQSGWDNDRDEYNQMLDDARNGDFDILVVRRGSRTGRDKRERIRRLFDLDEWGVEIHTAKRGYVDPEDPSDFLMEVFTAMTDDHGKRDEVELLETEMAKRHDRGWYIGEPPTGLRYDAEKKYLIADSDTIEDVERVYALRDDERTYREIADIVPWSPPTIGKLLERREVYEYAIDGGRLGFKLTMADSTTRYL